MRAYYSFLFLGLTVNFVSIIVCGSWWLIRRSREWRNYRRVRAQALRTIVMPGRGARVVNPYREAIEAQAPYEEVTGG